MGAELPVICECTESGRFMYKLLVLFSMTVVHSPLTRASLEVYPKD